MTFIFNRITKQSSKMVRNFNISWDTNGYCLLFEYHSMTARRSKSWKCVKFADGFFSLLGEKQIQLKDHYIHLSQTSKSRIIDPWKWD